MKIATIPDNDKIAEDGAYRMSMDWYHQQCAIGPSISSTGLRQIALESPWHYWSASPLNERRYAPPEESDALSLGKAVHSLILGDEVFDENFVFVPDGAPRKPTTQQLQAYERDDATEIGKRSVEFWKEFEQRAAGRTLLTPLQMEKITHMAENLARSPEANEFLTKGLVEVSVIWEDPITGVWLKSRIDNIPQGADFADLKTISPRTKSIKRAVHQAITDHAYHMQMGLAAIGAEHVLGHVVKDCILIFVQTTAPYTVTPVRLDEEALDIGKVLCRSAIDKFAHGLESGEWPMPVEGILEYSVPPSLAERFYDDQAEGLLPNLGAA